MSPEDREMLETVLNWGICRAAQELRGERGLDPCPNLSSLPAIKDGVRRMADLLVEWYPD